MIIHLTGEDTYRSARRLAELRSAFVAKHDPQGFNTVTLDGSVATLNDIRNAVSASGFFAQRRFVSIDRYDASGPVSGEELSTTIQPYASAKHDVIIVVRDVRGTEKTARGKGATKKKSSGMITLPDEKTEVFTVLSPVQTVSWIEREAKNVHGSITTGAAKRLAALCENDSWRIASELEKLLLYACRDTITEQHVDDMVRGEYTSDIFALTDALGARSSAQALHLLHQEFESGTNEFALIASLASHVRNLFHVQQALQSGKTASVIASELGLHPFVVQKAVAQTKHFTLDELHQLHDRLLQIDHSLKTSPLDAETLLDVLMITR